MCVRTAQMTSQPILIIFSMFMYYLYRYVITDRYSTVWDMDIMDKQQSNDKNNIIVGKHVLETVKLANECYDGIAECVDKFTSCVDAFMEIVNKSSDLQNGERNVPYMRDLEHCVNIIRKIYNIPERKMVRIDLSQLNLDVWGHVYWDFLHNASILIQEAFYKKQITTLLNFPALVYNIDNILPCPVCLSHYLAIKQETENENILQLTCFGLLVNGLFRFHTLINNNVQKIKVFNELDFALKYKCYARTVADQAINYGIIPRHVLFHQESHTRLSILLNIVYGVDLFKLSNMLKRLFSKKVLAPDEFEHEREFTVSNIPEFINIDNRETASVIGFCHNNGYPPPEMNVKSFASLEDFKHIAEYWIAAIDDGCAEKTRTICFKNKQVVVIKNNTLQLDATNAKTN